jgi:hypothetical protein
MSRIHRKLAGLSLAGLLALGVSLTRPADVWASCYGLRYDYSSTSALLDIVGSKISCPGYPDQHDMDANGQYVVTPWYTTQPIVCPCPTGGGGGGSLGADPFDHDGPP